MVNAKIWIKSANIVGWPKLEDFTLKEEQLEDCQDGDVIIEAEFISIDPHTRHRLDSLPIDSMPIASQVAKVIVSKNENYPVGSYLFGRAGWRSHTLITRHELEDKSVFLPYTKVTNLGTYSRSTVLGVLGATGNTAYFGFLEICQPKTGETVLVNGAAGAVGSIVCQIAKIKGCKVIAFAGSDVKVAWIKELGVDYAFNYKKDDISDSIKGAAPEGINCYFDNVGGEFSSKVLPHMSTYGRVSVCGAISTYNETKSTASPSPYTSKLIILKQLRVEGFLISRFNDRWMEGISQIRKWLENGEIQYKETMFEGFEKLPEALLAMLHGENIGKMIVKV